MSKHISVNKSGSHYVYTVDGGKPQRLCSAETIVSQAALHDLAVDAARKMGHIGPAEGVASVQVSHAEIEGAQPAHVRDAAGVYSEPKKGKPAAPQQKPATPPPEPPAAPQDPKPTA